MASSCTTLYMRKRRIALVNGVVSVEERTKEVHNMELLERQCGPQTEDKASHYSITTTVLVGLMITGKEAMSPLHTVGSGTY